jgi:hypothetical protein
MENELLQKLVDKSLTKEELLRKVKQDYKLIPKFSSEHHHQKLLSDTDAPKY